MHNEVETKSRRRRMTLMIMAAAFLVWQVPAMDFFNAVPGSNEKLNGFLSAAGFLFWAGGLVFLLASGRAAARTESPQVSAALEDELVRSNRSKSFVVGYIATLVASGIVFATSLVKPLSGIDASHLILVIAVVSPMFAFVVLERRGA